ncbi:MAG: hypothetical protein P1P88_04360 [Bacteroidales bacterium]|nr:hypothetical protein [Bacteroidales bacterium]
MKKSKILMISGSLLLFSLFVFPLWNITLEAPQYPIPLGMNIWVNKLVGHQEGDIQNINLMNHYVGMKPLPEHMKEFDVFPIVIIVMGILGIALGFIGNKKLFLTWFIVMALLGIAGIYDFYLWEYDYGHNLSDKAAIKIPGMAYQPPLIGSKKILNFTAVSSPLTGAYLLFLGMFMTLAAFFVARKEDKMAKKKSS